ncbi:M24 family metallopeptidase [Sinorhizobium mexicanum]|uniref:Aminopeptidase P family protein n=1 Tax=Sinorhizobium mexicanum TaxID=375549 RepID=A0A859R5N3_9HYPH|nr:Xaa-Pro peptidase family protein [Sinorhizobium mexicanum]MBP1884144.1 Xaa-Pro aminopeptidase [Sinorhizobium mexicanum]QLL64858.1 aminopeptidase P family protein [Sinorhizobium mexicanum]
MEERLAKTIAAIKESGADWGLFTSPDGVAYALGHVCGIEAGPSPFAGGPSLGIVGAGGETALLVTNLEAATPSWAETIVTYTGFSYQQPTDVLENYLAEAKTLFARLKVGGRIAVERHALPSSIASLLEDHALLSIEPAFRRQRSIKTKAEIGQLREAALTASAGQKAFLAATRAGISELEAFAAIRLAMETRAGERLPVTGDLISGRERTSQFMGWPNNRIIEKGDPLICDLAPRVAGYWGDSCASAMIGTPSDGFRRLFSAARSALDLAIETSRPGLVIGELDRSLQAVIARNGYSYAHHSGHSIGTGVHEWPRIVGYEREALKEDMVIMIEPTALDHDVGGVRLEFMLHVTATGCEILTDFEHRPDIPA